MDYSENLTCTPKFEPQDAHFSGKQTTLHCSVTHIPNQPNLSYAYHLSDSTTHNSTFTELVQRSLIYELFPEALEYPLLRFKSDNVSTQYCSRFVFENYLKLSSEINLPIIVYFGVNGHGKGTVDAMSGWGLKHLLGKQLLLMIFFSIHLKS